MHRVRDSIPGPRRGPAIVPPILHWIIRRIARAPCTHGAKQAYIEAWLQMTFIPFIALQAATGWALTHNGRMWVVHRARPKRGRRKHSFKIDRLLTPRAPPARYVRGAIAALTERTEVTH